MRNPLVMLSDSVVKLIGDPHIGRRFEAGVPRDRRGEREAKQMAQLIAELETEADYVITVGDLFDNPYVSQFVIVSVARAALAAAERNPDTTFIHMAGNHDKPRNLSAVGAWVSFAKMVQNRLPNLIVATRPMRVGEIVVFPWEWDVTAREQVEQYADDIDNVELIVGHWDLKAFGDDVSHVAPVSYLQHCFGALPQIWSGHFHEPGDYMGGSVKCTGSMQPYSHGEDEQGDTYVTLSLAELNDADPVQLKDKCVRVLLEKGDEVPTLNCLALTVKRIASEENQNQVNRNSDWHSILRNAIKPLDKEVQDVIRERMPVSQE